MLNRTILNLVDALEMDAKALEAKRREWLTARFQWILWSPTSWALLAPAAWPTTMNVTKWCEWPAAQLLAAEYPNLAEAVETVKLTFEQNLLGAAWGHELHYLWPDEFEEPAIHRFLKFLEDPLTFYVPDYKLCGGFVESSEPGEIRKGLPVMARTNPHELGYGWWEWDWGRFLNEEVT